VRTLDCPRPSAPAAASSAIPALRAALNDQDGDVRQAASEALLNILQPKKKEEGSFVFSFPNSVWEREERAFLAGAIVGTTWYKISRYGPV
jgi:HEAT repeat protein